MHHLWGPAFVDRACTSSSLSYTSSTTPPAPSTMCSGVPGWIAIFCVAVRAGVALYRQIRRKLHSTGRSCGFLFSQFHADSQSLYIGSTGCSHLAPNKPSFLSVEARCALETAKENRRDDIDPARGHFLTMRTIVLEGAVPLARKSLYIGSARLRDIGST